jgi:hypothetical protein
VTEPDSERVRLGLTAALKGGVRGSDAADRLCAACADLLPVDGAALSISYDQGGSGRTLGASSALARELQELQFTFGEGPYLDALRTGSVVMVTDLRSVEADRWPAFTSAALGRGVQLVLALPVSAIHLHLGALDMYRLSPGDVDSTTLRAALIAAELASAPLLDVMGDDGDELDVEDPLTTWELSTLGRIEFYQATGMVMSQLHTGVGEAMVRLRGYAFAHDMTASAVAWEIIERRLRLDDDRSEQRREKEGDPG